MYIPSDQTFINSSQNITLNIDYSFKHCQIYENKSNFVISGSRKDKIYHLKKYAGYQLFQQHRTKSQDITKLIKCILQVNVIVSHTGKTIAVHQRCETAVVKRATCKINNVTLLN